jgi:hypothetical protein
MIKVYAPLYARKKEKDACKKTFPFNRYDNNIPWHINGVHPAAISLVINRCMIARLLRYSVQHIGWRFQLNAAGVNG